MPVTAFANGANHLFFEGVYRKMIIRNPVLSGFYPDPSVIRVGGDYYMAVSSFEYFPGVPLFHSKDLIHWQQIGYALDRPAQINLLGRKSSQGIYAPTLRYHQGVFYMITTDVYGIGNFYVTAADPAGPWSDPVRVPYGNIDPSLMFDDDGKVYVTVQAGFDADSHIIQYEIDIATGAALSEPEVVFRGDGGPWVEGPHLYKIKDMYYLMAASGGTGAQHREIIGRSLSPYGPFELLPHPILTHRDLPDHPVQCTGHTELVEDESGNWWAFFLGVRREGCSYSVLGRETFLAPVRWTADGWPLIDNNEGSAGLNMEWLTGKGQCDTEGQSHGISSESLAQYQMKFQGDRLDLEWCYVRTLPQAEEVSLIRRKGWLTLTGNPSRLGGEGAAVYVCRRQRHHAMKAETLLDYLPVAEGETAGLAVRLSDTAYLTLAVTLEKGIRYISAGGARKGSEFRLGQAEAGSSIQIGLRFVSEKREYGYWYSLDGQSWLSLGAEPALTVAPESEGAFTGVTLGLFASSGEGQPAGAPAYFQYFDYTGIPADAGQ